MSAIEKAQHLFGIKGNQAQVANTLFQWTQKAVEKAVDGDNRIFENITKNVRIVTDRYTGMIMEVSKLANDGKELPLFNGQYKLTNHSALRSQQRFEMEREEAERYFNQLLKTAVWHSAAGKRHLYEHKNGARIAVDVETHEIITVYKAEIPTVKLTIDRIASAVKREFKRMTTQYQREIRKMAEQKAQLGVIVAELTLNHVRCDAPHTKELIQSRIAEAKSQIESLANDIDAKLTQLQAAESEVKAVVGE